MVLPSIDLDVLFDDRKSRDGRFSTGNEIDPGARPPCSTVVPVTLSRNVQDSRVPGFGSVVLPVAR